MRPIAAAVIDGKGGADVTIVRALGCKLAILPTLRRRFPILISNWQSKPKLFRTLETLSIFLKTLSIFLKQLPELKLDCGNMVEESY